MSNVMSTMLENPGKPSKAYEKKLNLSGQKTSSSGNCIKHGEDCISVNDFLWIGWMYVRVSVLHQIRKCLDQARRS